jgi:hypothetical protein
LIAGEVTENHFERRKVTPSVPRSSLQCDACSVFFRCDGGVEDLVFGRADGVLQMLGDANASTIEDDGVDVAGREDREAPLELQLSCLERRGEWISKDWPKE